MSFSCNYLWINVVLPIFINVGIHIAARIINKSDKPGHDFKNAAVIYGVSITAIVVAIFHRDYIVTSCAYVFPIVLSALYNQKKTAYPHYDYCACFAYNHGGGTGV